MEIDKTLSRAAGEWNLDIRNIRRDISIQGSPERCELRFVIECKNDRLYLIESIFDTDIDHKLEIISCLDFLSGKGLSKVNKYISTLGKGYIVSSDDRFWQLSLFVEGETLRRPEYAFEKWRGKILADFLIELKEKSEKIPFFTGRAPFSIKNYIYRLISQIKEHDPEVVSGIEPVILFLEKRFMKIHDVMPVSFCHGDFHPLNIIWSENSIKAVIDWEFLGIKPEIYDAANLVGCIGIEDPEALTGELAGDFLAALKESGFISGICWEYFAEFVIALRFAWLSEWLRHKDREMIELETTYMNMLCDNPETLYKAWEI
jgi:homoserine kinase type II